MRVGDLVHETNLALSANKGRSALTVLGIVIGITAIVVMVSLITGFEVLLEDSMGLGSARVVTVSCDSDVYSLSEDDAEFLERAIEACDTAIPQVTTVVTDSTSEEDESTTSSTSDSSTTDEDSEMSTSMLEVIGVDPEYFEMYDTEFIAGTAYTADADMVAVLSEDVAEDAFGAANSSVIGQSYEISGNSYEVIGVVESSVLLSMLSVGMVYVPYQTACDSIVGSEQADELLCLAGEDADVDYFARCVEGALAARHGVEYDDDGTQSVYSATTTESSLEDLSSFTLAFDALAVLVAGIALLVGGIGIMNMMLTNVTERYREIGLRKSLGARPFDIRLQFLAESVALCVTGGIVGIVLGYAGAWGLAGLVGQILEDLSGLTPVIEPGLVALVFAICAAIGIIFGYYPARRASRLNPAETLRYQ